MAVLSMEGKHEPRTSRLVFLSIFSSNLTWFVGVFFSKQVNTLTTKDHFPPPPLPPVSGISQEKVIKSADVKNQLLVCPSSFPLRKQLGELVAQTQTSPRDLNKEALIWKINRCHVQHSICLKHCKTDTVIQKTPNPSILVLYHRLSYWCSLLSLVHGLSFLNVHVSPGFVFFPQLTPKSLHTKSEHAQGRKLCWDVVRSRSQQFTRHRVCHDFHPDKNIEPELI